MLLSLEPFGDQSALQRRIDDLKQARVATRLVFFLAGSGLAAWAPLVPFAKLRTGIDEATLGLLLLSLGLGSILAMPIAGFLVSRNGARPVIMLAAATLLVALPALTMVSDVTLLALVLLLFGAGVGSVDVAMNIQAIEVEKQSGVSLMSGFHGLFTLGSIFGAGGVTLMLANGLSPTLATCAISAATLAMLVATYPNLLTRSAQAKAARKGFAWPSGALLALAVLSFAAFLAEGVILDWSALFLVEKHEMNPAYGGLGYAVFAVAMTAGRLAGDRIVERFGGIKTIVLGAAVAALGYGWVVFAPGPVWSLVGFAAIGLGASNIVPVFFAAAGRQDHDAGMSISTITSFGYAGILAGPAIVGLIAQLSGLQSAFLAMAIVMAAIGLAGPAAVRFSSKRRVRI